MGPPAGAGQRFPVLFQLNARTFVRSLGPDATLDAVDDHELVAVAHCSQYPQQLGIHE